MLTTKTKLNDIYTTLFGFIKNSFEIVSTKKTKITGASVGFFLIIFVSFFSGQFTSQTFKAKKGKGSFSRHQKHKGLSEDSNDNNEIFIKFNKNFY